IRTRREIDALSGGDGARTQVAVDAEIAALEAELDLYRERGYTDEHPDVRRTEGALDALRAERERAPAAPGPTRPPDNPEYVRIDLEMRAAADALTAAEERRVALEAR